MGTSIKIEKYLNEAELADLLRELADALENGGKGDLACAKGFQKIKLAIKNEFGQIAVKMKIKPESTNAAEADGTGPTVTTSGKPPYKHLKKRMKASFKMILKMIHDGEMPPQEAINAFLEDSRLMVTYPGYGDEYYESYTQACDAFSEACKSGDMTRMHETVDILIHEKSRCHAKYD